MKSLIKLLFICSIIFFTTSCSNPLYVPMGIWKYKDDYLEMRIFVPEFEDTEKTELGCVWKGELICSEKTYAVEFQSTEKMGYIDIYFADAFDEYKNGITTFVSPTINSQYWVSGLSNKKLALEKISIKEEGIYKDIFTDYEGKEIVFNRICDYIIKP